MNKSHKSHKTPQCASHSVTPFITKAFSTFAVSLSTLSRRGPIFWRPFFRHFSHAWISKSISRVAGMACQPWNVTSENELTAGKENEY